MAENGHLMSPSENARKLKAIRSRAIGLRELARAIGWDASRYQYYEDSYKKPYMPLELIELIRPHLLGLGDPPVTEPEIDSLLPPPRKQAVQAPVQQPRQRPDSSTRFGAYIRETREARGISLRDLARLVDIPRNEMTQIEAEDWKPSESTLRRIARVLGIEGDDLVRRAERTPSELSDFVKDPSARPVFAALARTTKDLPPDELAKLLQQLAKEAAKSKP